MNVVKAEAVKAGGWDGRCVLTPAAREEMEWWVKRAHHFNGNWLRPPVPQHVLTTDASELAWGATLQRAVAARGPPTEARECWEEEIAQQFQMGRISVNVLELEAVLRALKLFRRELRGSTVVLRSDNASTVWDLTKWKSRSPPMNMRLRGMFLCLHSEGITLIPQHIPGMENVEADRLSRYLEASDWQLNPTIFGAIQKRRRRCRIDAMASARNHLLPRFWTWKREPGATATNVFHQHHMDPDSPLWINPPFNLIRRVLLHVNQTQARATVVVPDWGWANWWPPPLTLPRLADTFRPVSQRNSHGVGPPPWQLWACELSGMRQDQREAQQAWGEALHRPDDALVARFGLTRGEHAQSGREEPVRKLHKLVVATSWEAPW